MKKMNKEQRANEAVERLKRLDDLLKDRLQKTDSAMEQVRAIGSEIESIKNKRSA